MSSLPVSVRMALWTTAAYAGRVDLSRVLTLAAPDVPCHGGRLDCLRLWRDLGEKAVLVALPRPGDVTGLPRGSAGFVDAATAVGECVYVAGLGASLVPRWGYAGGPGERSQMLTWGVHDCEPMPIHRLEALSLREVDSTLRAEVASAVTDLEALDAHPWDSRGLRQLADVELAGSLGLPDGLPNRALRVISLAANLGTVADLGLERLGDTHSLAVTTARRSRLRQLQAVADASLAQGACVAAMTLAGWRSAHD